MNAPIRLISSMATRRLVEELIGVWRDRGAAPFDVEALSVGGVDVARRVRAGERFDVVMLASDAIDALIADGRIVPGSRVDLVESSVAIAVRSGTTHPDVGSETAVRAAVEAAGSIGYSTGPSGVALGRLFERWGIAGTIADRLVQAPAGVPVGSMVADGRVDLGFQQLSELMGMQGIDVLGPMPAPIAIITTFSAGVAVTSERQDDARLFIAHLSSPDMSDIKRRNGMAPPVRA